MLLPSIVIDDVIPLLNKRSSLFASIVISKVLVEVSAVGDMNVISPFFVTEFELLTIAFVPTLTLLISDSDK